MSSTSIVRVATDVGGTFTDLVYFRTDSATGAQQIITEKADTTPPDFERGVLDVIAKAGVDVAAVDFVAHGTTVVINALTERKGAKVALITTSGFRDSLEIARGNRPDFFNLMYRKPTPFVPRYLRREVPGRMTWLAQEREPLDLTGLPAILDDFRAERVEAIAVCLLHSYANPDHELRLVGRIRELWPQIPVVASHQITREWREYERSNTTVLSAYVQPVAERYLNALSKGLVSRGFGGQLYVMQSNCGVDTVGRSSAVPITMVESGPASGFWGRRSWVA
jgi:N-methylhydantoinase A